jgi:hypothetical protein
MVWSSKALLGLRGEVLRRKVSEAEREQQPVPGEVTGRAWPEMPTAAPPEA